MASKRCWRPREKRHNTVIGSSSTVHDRRQHGMPVLPASLASSTVNASPPMPSKVELTPQQEPTRSSWPNLPSEVVSKMADSAVDVRTEERVKIKIGEVKNLPPRSHGSMVARDCFCTLSLDQEEIFRTATADKTLSPYFGEEFQFEVPRKFRFLSLYIYDRDKAMKQVKVLGKVAIKKEELSKIHGKDHWLPIQPVDANSEVQGKVHVEIKRERCMKPNSDGLCFPRLIIRNIECSDLAIINGACDPYAVVTLVYSDNNFSNKRTKVRKKTVNPQFDEVFVYELYSKNQTNEPNIFNLMEEDVGHLELRVTLYHDSGGTSAGTFLGEIKISLQGIDKIDQYSAWYFLQPRDKSIKMIKTAKPAKPDLGSLRLRIDYTSDHVFSSHYYDALRNLILQSPEVKPITSSAAYILGEITPNKVEAAQSLVKVFVHHKKMVPFIRSLAEYEISKLTDVNTVFRGNTLVSKCMDEFMKLAGHHYLQDTLKSIIDQIFLEHKPCEIDPCKLKDNENIDANMANLRDYVDRILKAITQSSLVCPPVMCEVFSLLRELATTYFPDTKELQYSVVSGFVFLRFFAPAILGPRLFELSTETADQQTIRTLTLISKTIQSMGNLVSSKSSQIFKEEYMITMYKGFINERHINDIRVFLEIISSSPSRPHKTIDSPVILKEGVMIKRAQGRKKFGIKNFKKRYFCLTTQEFMYLKSKGDDPLCRIPVNQILAVEKLQEESFKMKNMFQVVRQCHALYIQANNCVEEKEWIDILNKVCQSNKNRLNEYHPGAFINGHWQCCRSASEAAVGCCPVSIVGVPPTIKVNIDSDREIERIHSLFLCNNDKLERLIGVCESQAVYTGDSKPPIPGLIIEDTQTCFKTLKAIQKCVFSLQNEHKKYLRDIYRQTKYGSEQAPIGDDNYLMMAAQNARL
ncbi:hypothetical protein CHUAL_003760 [Chamberlinius hualienensis]